MAKTPTIIERLIQTWTISHTHGKYEFSNMKISKYTRNIWFVCICTAAHAHIKPQKKVVYKYLCCSFDFFLVWFGLVWFRFFFIFSFLRSIVCLLLFSSVLNQHRYGPALNLLTLIGFDCCCCCSCCSGIVLLCFFFLRYRINIVVYNMHTWCVFRYCSHRYMNLLIDRSILSRSLNFGRFSKFEFFNSIIGINSGFVN